MMRRELWSRPSILGQLLLLEIQTPEIRLQAKYKRSGEQPMAQASFKAPL